MSSFDIVAGSDFHFYVVEDLRSSVLNKHTYSSLNEALDCYRSAQQRNAMLSALGIERGQYALDLLHGVNGRNVLVQEYKFGDASEALGALAPVLDKIGAYLVDEAGVQCTYCYDLFPRVSASVPVVVPMGNNLNGFESSYCSDKRLKTIGGGLDSINQLLVDGHGWVNYMDLMEDAAAFCENGVLMVSGVNVNYCMKMNLTGMDGRMDVSVHDFVRMLSDLDKEYALQVFDHRFCNSYVVDSFDNLKDAVRAWYELPVEARAQVVQTVGYNYQQVVFNGIGDDFEEITYETAAKMYGFESGGLESTLSKAIGLSREMHSQAAKEVSYKEF